MDLCHVHNLNRDLAAAKRYGIRVTLPPGDSFNRLLGEDWERFHWYATPQERDRALEEMTREHLYSRGGDKPTVICEAIERPAEKATPAA